MAAQPIGGSKRYVHRGATRVYVVDEIADIQAPTRGELDAGVDVSPELASVDGWMLRAATVSERMVGQKFVEQRVMWLEMGSDVQSLVMYADRAGADVRSMLPLGAVTHVVMLHGGDVAGHRMDVWPVEVAATPMEITGGTLPAQIQVDFVVRGQPAPGVEVPPHD